ncbi:MAG: hypothetical protein KBD48_00625 [Candidatus Pacebacteria bacterium]|nr:hypothetical protein [Candidatus Paceibacterota bacterium]MBP9715684.1 hypothetical protein [Candidatus Paceibacterota bacterium]
MKKVLLVLSLSVLGTGIKSSSATEAELFVDSLVVGKNSISIYGDCSVFSVHTHLYLFLGGIFSDGDTLDTYGLTPFSLRADKLLPGTPYLVKIVIRDYSGTDTITIGSITTLSGNGWDNGGSNGALKIKNQSLTRFSGAEKIELRGTIELSPKSTAVAYAAVFSDSLCKHAVAPVSTKLNYNNVNNFSSISNLYYNFNIDTNAYSMVWGKFWGSDNLGNSTEDPSSVGMKVITLKPTGFGEIDQKKKIFLYPVPTTDILFFEYFCQYSIIDINGIRVKTGEGTSTDVSDLPAGYYVLRSDKGRSGRFWKN